MDLKDFKNVDNNDDSKVTKTKNNFVDQNFHDESDQIIKDLEARIAALNNESKKPEAAVEENISEPEEVEDPETNLPETEEVLVDTGKDETFLDKIQPFILPICLTLFSLVFAAIFLFFFSKSRVEKSVQAITNQQSQPEVIIVKENKPETKEVVVIPEKVIPECDPETQYLNEETNECEDLETEKPILPEKSAFENGTTTVIKVRFAYDKFNYDNFPRGIYLLSEQVFSGEYEDYKLLATNRPYANDMFFGVNRNMVSLMGACQFVVDEADILVENVQDSEGDQVYSAIKDKYFRGKVLKILEASKPHIICNK